MLVLFSGTVGGVPGAWFVTKYKAVFDGDWRNEAGVKRDCSGLPLRELDCLAVQ